jgi:UDP-N-acetylmuramate: L-alanyl-gamma-D-glutamyl-meso-diaminopimelate ligase
VHVHFIGVCGTAMATLAAMLQQRGHRVTGSDAGMYPPMSDFLAREGVATFDGFDASHVDPAADMVVVGNAISRGNVELEAVLDRRQRYQSLPECLRDQFLWDRRPVVVTGTHGKTTTTALTTWVLTHGGLDPSMFVGGITGNFASSYRLGAGRDIVVEGDEYDSAFFDKTAKFLKYVPDIGVVNNIEFDHADIYRDLEEIVVAFRRFVRLIPASGRLIVNGDDPVVRGVVADAHCEVETFGVWGQVLSHSGSGLVTHGESHEFAWDSAGDTGGQVSSRTGSDLDPPAHASDPPPAAAPQPAPPASWQGPTWCATNLNATPDGVTFDVLLAGRRLGRATLPMPGHHNVRNALVALAVGHARGLSFDRMCGALADFRGVKRRMEVRGVANGVTVFDDFAHHPTAIAQTLAGVRRAYPAARIWAVFEPRSASSCRRVFQQAFSEAFDAADVVVLASVFRSALPEAERLSVDELVDALVARGLQARYIPTAAAIAQIVAAETQPGDLVVVMSNGGFDAVHDRLLDALRALPAASG